jgi:antitoxin (DNA-binding transcriptional repressor) of toxin-antitoxin stability system
MSVKVTIHQLQEQLPALLEHTVQSGEECIVQRDGKDYAVIVSARGWRRRTLGRRLDALGPQYQLAKEKQERVEELLAKSQESRLTRAERRDLNALLQECDAIMLRRAAALDTSL